MFLSVTKGNVAAANVLYRRFQQRRRAQAGAARDAKAATTDAAPAAAKGSDDGVLTPDWAQETDEKTDDVFATDRATAAPTTVPSSKEPESAATAPAEAAESPAGKSQQEEKDSVPIAEGDPGKADVALAQAETTEHVSSAPAAKASAAADSGAGASEAEPKPTQAAELDDLFGALKSTLAPAVTRRAETPSKKRPTKPHSRSQRNPPKRARVMAQQRIPRLQLPRTLHPSSPTRRSIQRATRVPLPKPRQATSSRQS